MTGNLCYQIEHHLYPDLPSDRFAQIARRVQAVCAANDLLYVTGPLTSQYLLVPRLITKRALPDRLWRTASDESPQAARDYRSANRMTRPRPVDSTARRPGLAIAIGNRNNQRQASGDRRSAASSR